MVIWIDVASSNLDKVAYSTEKRELLIKFKNRKKEEHYIYENVPPDIFGELILAKSKGKYFAKFLRDKYPYKKVE